MMYTTMHNVSLHTININPGRMSSAGNVVGGNTFVQSTVSGLYARDVQMTDNVAAWTQILPYHQPGSKNDIFH